MEFIKDGICIELDIDGDVVISYTKTRSHRIFIETRIEGELDFVINSLQTIRQVLNETTQTTLNQEEMK